MCDIDYDQTNVDRAFMLSQLTHIRDVRRLHLAGRLTDAEFHATVDNILDRLSE